MLWVWSPSVADSQSGRRDAGQDKAYPPFSCLGQIYGDCLLDTNTLNTHKGLFVLLTLLLLLFFTVVVVVVVVVVK